MAISKRLNGSWILEPFLPGHYEEYEILNDGRTRFLKSVNYHKPGDKPSFQTYTPWTGERIDKVLPIIDRGNTIILHVLFSLLQP